jgi:hypothetical protein
MKSPIQSLIVGPRIDVHEQKSPLVGRAPSDEKGRPFDTHLGAALGKPKPRPEARGRGRSVDPRDKKPAHASKTHDRSAKAKAARKDDERNEDHEEKRVSRGRPADPRATTETGQQPSPVELSLTMPTAFIALTTRTAEPLQMSPSTSTVQAATEQVQTAWFSAPETAITEAAGAFSNRLQASVEQQAAAGETTAQAGPGDADLAVATRSERTAPTTVDANALSVAGPLAALADATSTGADAATVTEVVEASSATAAIASTMTPSPTSGAAPGADGEESLAAPAGARVASPGSRTTSAQTASASEGADVRSRGTRPSKTGVRPMATASPGSSGPTTGGPGARAQAPTGEPGTASNAPPLVEAANERASSARTGPAASTPSQAESGGPGGQDEAKTESVPATIVGNGAGASARAETGAVEPGTPGVIHSAPHVNRLTGESAPPERAPVDLTTAVREAESVGHKRALGGEAHGAITLENGGKFEVRARSHGTGHVDVQVRAEEEIGRSMLHQHASELRADLRAEIPRASVTLPDMSSGAGGGRDSRAYEGQGSGQGFGGTRSPVNGTSGVDSAKQHGNSASGPRQSARVRIVL